MSRRPRRDEPGSVHHVMNGAVGKRPLFESPDDILQFLELIAEASVAGLIAVYAYCVLSTHFHILLRSLVGRLSTAMRDIESIYARRFNASHARVGPLMRHRYLSKRVVTERNLKMALRYIDFNAVDAGLVRQPSEYEFGSAQAYELGGGPSWLHREPIERLVMRTSWTGRFDGALYRGCFGTPVSEQEGKSIVEALARKERVSRLGPLLAAVPAVREELRRRALIGDGITDVAPFVDHVTLHDVIARLRSEHGPWTRSCRSHGEDGWKWLEAALLGLFCGETQEAIGDRIGWPRSSVRNAIRSVSRGVGDPLVARQVERVVSGLPEDLRARVPDLSLAF
jgi:putative transposase